MMHVEGNTVLKIALRLGKLLLYRVLPDKPRDSVQLLDVQNTRVTIDVPQMFNPSSC